MSIVEVEKDETGVPKGTRMLDADNNEEVATEKKMEEAPNFGRKGDEGKVVKNREEYWEEEIWQWDYVTKGIEKRLKDLEDGEKKDEIVDELKDMKMYLGELQDQYEVMKGETCGHTKKSSGRNRRTEMKMRVIVNKMKGIFCDKVNRIKADRCED